MIKDLKPPLNKNVGSEKRCLYQPFIYFPADFDRSVYYQFFAIVLIRFQSFSFAFKSYFIISNRHYWGCMLRHTISVKSLIKVFCNIRCFVMFVTAVCILFCLSWKGWRIRDFNAYKFWKAFVTLYLATVINDIPSLGVLW